MMSGWRWLVFKDDGEYKIRSHAVPHALVEVVLDDLVARRETARALLNPAKCQDSFDPYCIDYGGMIRMGTPKDEIRLGDRTLQFHMYQGGELVEDVRARLDDQTRWRSGPNGGVPWVKLHGQWHCCVVTVDELRAIGAYLATRAADWATALALFEAEKNAVIDATPGLWRPGKKTPADPSN